MYQKNKTFEEVSSSILNILKKNIIEKKGLCGIMSLCGIV